MSRLPAILALSGLLAVIALVALPVAALADDVDDYYEDEYAEDEPEGDADDAEPEEAVEDVPARLKFARSGFYMYAGGAFILAQLPAEQGASDTGAINFKIGARFHHYFAAEFEYQTIPHWDFNFEPSSESPAIEPKQETDVHSFTFNAKAYYPMSRFQPFLQLGLGLAMTDAPGNQAETAFEMRYGAGLEYFVTDQFAVGLTVVRTSTFGNELPVDDAPDGNYAYTSFIGSIGFHF